jgi:hypothetical protein
MARTLRAGQPHRASAEMALHVLEMMAEIDASGADGEFHPLESAFTVPEPLDAAWDPHEPSAA